MKKNSFLIALAITLLAQCATFGIEEDFSPIELAVPKQEEKDDGTLRFFSQIKKDELYTLDNYRTKAESSSVNVEAITRDDIKKQNSPTIAELLNQTGSVTIQNSNGSVGSTTTARIRGTDRVRLTVDGIRADRPSLTTAGAEFQNILSDDIEFVEVIKGTQGNIFGTNASGGAINMQTRRGEGPLKWELGSEMGKYGTFKERGAIFGGNDKADFYLSTTYLKSDGGMRTNKQGRLFNDGYRNLNVVLNNGFYLLDRKAELRNVFRMSNSRKNIPTGYSNWTYQNYNDPNDYSKNFDMTDSLSFKHNVNDYYNYNITGGILVNRYNSYIVPDDIAPHETSRSKINSTRLNFMTQHNFKYKFNTLSLGYNLENEYISGTSDAYKYGTWPMFPLVNYYDKYSGSTLQNDVYVHDVINIKDRLILRGGARLVNNSKFGTHVAPNASAAVVLPTFKIKGAKTKFRGSWGKTVNNPTLYQRYGGFTDSWMAWSGNNNLDPEKMESFDFGVEQSFMDNKLKFELGYFHSKYKDYIGAHYNIDPITYYTSGYYTNIDSAKIDGYEARMVYEPNDILKFVLNYTYTDSKDKTTGNVLPATPNNRINGTVYLTPHERLTLYAGIENASSRTMSTASTDRVDGYTDARIGTTIRLFSVKDTHVYLKGNIYNLFNQDICMYRNSLANENYYAPKISYTVGLFIEYNPDKIISKIKKDKKKTEDI